MTNPNVVLFLDVDGVLNSAVWFAKQPPMAVTEVDPKAVRRLQRIIDRTDAKVVLSSSWRGSAELEAKLRASGVHFDDVTPKGEDRGQEIAAWLYDHPEVTTFAIVDDDPDAGRLEPDHYVRTYWRSGMYGKHERAIVALLSEPPIRSELEDRFMKRGAGIGTVTIRMPFALEMLESEETREVLAEAIKKAALLQLQEPYPVLQEPYPV